MTPCRTSLCCATSWASTRRICWTVRPSCCVNKSDLLSEQRQAELQQAFDAAGLSVRFISAATQSGINELLWAIWQILDGGLEPEAEGGPPASAATRDL